MPVKGKQVLHACVVAHTDRHCSAAHRPGPTGRGSSPSGVSPARRLRHVRPPKLSLCLIDVQDIDAVPARARAREKGGEVLGLAMLLLGLAIA